MSALAERTGAVNLGQGFPDEDGPAEVLEAAAAAMRDGWNQYAPLVGVPALRAAIAAHQEHFYGLSVDPDAGVQVTFGATEAIAAAMLGLLEPGDEVVVFEPLYDSYAASIAMAGAVRRVVTLRPPDWRFDADALRSAVGPRTRMVLLNSPHNPTGKVFSRAELEVVAAVVREHDLVAVADEVYEHLVYEGSHVPLATLEGMADRTLTISSLGKTFSVTGWKIGWATGPPELVGAVRAAKQFLSFAGGTPLQVAPVAGTYFVNAMVEGDGVDFCRALPGRAGVVAIPTAVFYDDPDVGRSLVRFAFCKRDAVIDEAVARLAAGG